jgi:hypothetical protein
LQWVALSVGWSPTWDWRRSFGAGRDLRTAALSSIGCGSPQRQDHYRQHPQRTHLLLILISGFKNYIKLQNVMIVATMIAFLTNADRAVHHQPNHRPDKLNAFSVAAERIGEFLPRRSTR